MKKRQKEFDFIIVGSGPGGATVARELSRKNKKVLILEWGDRDPVKGTLRQMANRSFIPGKSMLITAGGLGMVRAITSGGSSSIYCATAFDPPTDMLMRYGVDITQEVSEARKEVPNEPLSDDLISPAGRRFMESALDLGYDCKKLNKFIYQNKCMTNCQLCMYGCPYGAKWTARNFLNDALENDARIINHAKVKKVIVKGGKAVGVEYKTKKETYHAFAPKVIISAGGISSPLILRDSGIRDVGYEFFFDPLIILMGKASGVNGGRGIPMSTGIHMEEEGVVMTDFNLPYFLKMIFDMEVFKFGQLFSYSNTIPIMVKVRDGLGGRVVNNSMIWKKLTRKDKKKIDNGAKHATRILENAGATKIYRSWYLAAHPGGTIKIGEHLDENLKTEMDNLYVCDCSVIPEAWGVPPTLTIIGLGKRLAKHLLSLESVETETITPDTPKLKVAENKISPVVEVA